MSVSSNKIAPGENVAGQGDFLEFAGERYYVIRDMDQMPSFFVSVVSADDHWLFASSLGGLSAGRVSPKTSLFPYVTVDKLHDSYNSAGPKTILRVGGDSDRRAWEPFNHEQRGRYATSCNLYKNVLGNKLCYEEINHDLSLTFRFTWSTSAEFGFVRHCELHNFGSSPVEVDFVDGLQNILPAGTPLFAQTNTSNLVDAYKWTELDEASGLAFLTLYSGISDRAEPCESLKATTVFSLGLDDPTVLISANQLEAFRRGESLSAEKQLRGIRGAYFVNDSASLNPKATCEWRIVLDAEQSQSDAVALRQRLAAPDEVAAAITKSVQAGCDSLARIMASADGFQSTAEENVSVHHYANVLFNVLRGGIFEDQYAIPSLDFRNTIKHFNKAAYDRNRSFLRGLPERLRFDELLAAVREQDDAQLQRLTLEYLPITFGRRHGDPSRPWNQFSIRLRDDDGNRLLSYEGNWRDIFQNWEALALSFPSFIENMIAKFVNASTADGYNPYRITKEGIDWEVEEPDNPWSYIGYWGDHQIIYLQKLLELSNEFHPAALRSLLREPLFSYANVPYRIKPLDEILKDPKSTVLFDNNAAEHIERQVKAIGADGKLLTNKHGQVYQVNLLEKLLVPLLAKLGNLVADGGIWLNTQRPEWNDANNALVGHGLSMVTLYYMRRYIRFLKGRLASESDAFILSNEVGDWLEGTATALAKLRPVVDDGLVDDARRYDSLTELGRAASECREAIYKNGQFSGSRAVAVENIVSLLDDALAVVDHSIAANKRDDGLYHAYNIADFDNGKLAVAPLYPMLEGQVAALSAGALDAEETVAVVDALFASKVYREDQHSFMLYPDRHLPGFFERNRIPADQVNGIALLKTMRDAGDERVILRDADDNLRFNADFVNAGDLNAMLDRVSENYGEAVAADRDRIVTLYEDVFDHKSFTGRSGTMFGFEGLGSIYWHMVSKLLLAVQENFYRALDKNADPATVKRVGQLYYKVRTGIGFNKSPAEYGAFPTDPYSHTPKHAGARQPGMTGQVKEEILTRFGELGIRVRDGAFSIQASLLRAQEFRTEAGTFCYLDVDKTWQTLDVPAASLAFTWCQAPLIYTIDDDAQNGIVIHFDDSSHTQLEGLSVPTEICTELFERTGRIRRIDVTLSTSQLFAG